MLLVAEPGLQAFREIAVHITGNKVRQLCRGVSKLHLSYIKQGQALVSHYHTRYKEREIGY